jgi:tetratricopeptide (TPR) repeat protein
MKWGGVARRGARSLERGDDVGPSASDVWRQAVARAAGSDDGERPREPWTPEETWIVEPEPDEPEAGHRRSTTVGRPSSRPGAQPRDLATGRDGVASPGGRRRKVPRPVLDELVAASGPDRGDKLAARMANATYAYERERYQDARRILRTLADEIPRSPAVRELYGLVLYRTGQWAQAARQLEAYRELSGSFDQHPVLADCYRALHRWDDVEAIWSELREASPSADLVAEGRIVAAGARADQGDLAGGIDILTRTGRRIGRVQERHLRQWYALADLHERAGDLPRARDLFTRVAATDPDAFDVRARIRSLA